MVPLGAEYPLTVARTFALTLRALVRRSPVHVRFGAAFVALFAVTYSCLSAAFDAAGSVGESARGAIQLSLRLVLFVFSVGAFALHRGFTVATVVATLRDAPLRFVDARGLAIARWGEQVGVESIRVALENLPGLVPGVLLFGFDGDRDVARALGYFYPYAERFVAAAFAVSVLAYVLWSTFVRAAIGPAPAVTQLSPGGLVASIRRSATIANAHRGPYARLRVLFGVVALALCLDAIVPASLFMSGAMLTGSASMVDPMDYPVVVGFGVLFYGFVYLLFVLDAALDATFCVHLYASPRPERATLAQVFS